MDDAARQIREAVEGLETEFLGENIGVFPVQMARQPLGCCPPPAGASRIGTFPPKVNAAPAVCSRARASPMAEHCAIEGS